MQRISRRTVHTAISGEGNKRDAGGGNAFICCLPKVLNRGSLLRNRETVGAAHMAGIPLVSGTAC